MNVKGTTWRNDATCRLRAVHPLSLRLATLTSLSCLVGSGLLGCRTPLKPVFEPVANAPTWPSAPTKPRIRYVGQLRTAADLKPARKAWDVFRDLMAGPEKPDALFGPRSVVCSRSGERVWVCDPGGRCVDMLDLTDRTFTRITRIGQSQLLTPIDICIGPPGTLFLCDAEASSIYKIKENDGTLIETVQTDPDLLRAVALDWNPQTSELFVLDIGAHNVKVLNEKGRTLRIIGRRGNAPGEFNYPSDLLIDRDRIWVADSGNRRIQGISLKGDPPIVIGKAGDAPGDFALPKSIAIDSDGHIYVVDARFENIQVFDRAGQLLLYWGEEGNGPGEFWLPGGIHIDANDRIWVCDSYNNRIQVFDYLKLQTQPDRSQSRPDLTSHKPAQEQTP